MWQKLRVVGAVAVAALAVAALTLSGGPAAAQGEQGPGDLPLEQDPPEVELDIPAGPLTTPFAVQRGWVWTQHDEFTAEIWIDDSQRNAGIETLSFKVPRVEAYCLGYGVTVDLGNGERPTDGNDIILGTSGDDTINAGRGDDVVCAGDGNDRIRGDFGDDLILGEGGRDRIWSGPGNDAVAGGTGRDRIRAGRGSDLVVGEGGRDTIWGGPGDDELFGGGGNDRLDGGSGANALQGGTGVDSCRSARSALGCES